MSIKLPGWLLFILYFLTKSKNLIFMASWFKYIDGLLLKVFLSEENRMMIIALSSKAIISIFTSFIYRHTRVNRDFPLMNLIKMERDYSYLFVSGTKKASHTSTGSRKTNC